jgi:SAM-dependent methyltransferase
MMDSLNIKKEFKELILRCLSANYMGESCKDGIKTLNHYQSVALGEIQTTGVRTDRSKFLDQIDLQGKRVLDLGSNLGEVSRAARVRGACLVDGFEYDQYFVEIANLINAYNGTTRVSFYQRDITDPLVYDEHYDVVLAFSVFVYIHPVLEQIASITDQLLVLETHKLEGNLDSYYLKPVLQYFPCYRILGESEWMADHGDSGKRAIIAFAKEESAMASAFEASLVNTEAPRKTSAVVSSPKQGPNS